MGRFSNIRSRLPHPIQDPEKRLKALEELFDAGFVLTTAQSNLPHAQSLSALGSGLLKVANGVLDTLGSPDDIFTADYGDVAAVGFTDTYFKILNTGSLTNQLVFSLTNAAAAIRTIVSGHTADRSNTIPDVGGAFGMLDGTPQLWTGRNTFYDNDGFTILAEGGNPNAQLQFQTVLASNLTVVRARATALRTIDLPDASGTLALTTDVDTARTWSTLQTFKDTTWKLVDDADATKTLVFSLGGATTGADLTLAWAGTVDRTLTLPNVTSTLAALGLAQTWTALQTYPNNQLKITDTVVNTRNLVFYTNGSSDNTTLTLAFQNTNDRSLVFSLAGAAFNDLTLSWTGTASRTLTLPDRTGTLFIDPLTTLGDTIYSDGTNGVRLAGNITTTRKFLRQTGTGAASAAPTWDTLLDGDLPSTLSANARVAVSKNSGATVGTRRRINFIEGTSITLTITDDSGNEEVDVTIASSGGPGGSSFADDVFDVHDNLDVSKILKLQCSGIAPTTTRTWTVADADGTVPLLGLAQTWTAAQTLKPSATVPSDALFFDIDAPGTNSARDSHRIRLRGTSYDGSAHTVDWRIHNDVTTNSGASTLRFAAQLDEGGYSNYLSISDAGIMTVTYIGVGTLIRTSTVSAGAGFCDNTDVTKALRMILSGAVGNNSMTAAGTAARSFDAIAASQVTVDFGTGAQEARITVTDAGIVGTSKITASLAYQAATGRDLDENDMDEFHVMAGNVVAGTSYDVVVRCITGTAHGEYAVNVHRN